MFIGCFTNTLKETLLTVGNENIASCFYQVHLIRMTNFSCYKFMLSVANYVLTDMPISIIAIWS